MCVLLFSYQKWNYLKKKQNSKEQWFHLFKTRGLYLQMILYSVLKTGNIVLILALLIIKQNEFYEFNSLLMNWSLEAEMLFWLT